MYSEIYTHGGLGKLPEKQFWPRQRVPLMTGLPCQSVQFHFLTTSQVELSYRQYNCLKHVHVERQSCHSHHYFDNVINLHCGLARGIRHLRGIRVTGMYTPRYDSIISSV